MNRSLPVLDLVPPEPAVAPRDPVSPADARLAEYRPDLQTLPTFHVWTLGCQMNRSDSEEMAGRLLAAGCAEASGLESADLIVINTCAIREGAEQKVVGRQGHLARLKAANPGLRVVLTGCAVREPDRAGLRRRFPAVDLFLRPDEEPELVDRLGLASAQAPIGAGGPVGATDDRIGRTVVGAADRLPATRAAARSRTARSRARARRQRLAADRLRLRQDVHLLHRPVQPRAGAEPPVRRRSSPRRARWPRPAIREVTLLGQNVNSYGHDLPRRAALRARRHRALGRPPARPGRPAGPGRADPGDRRDPDRRRRAGDPAAALRHVASMGPVGPARRGDGRVPVRLRAPPPAGPVGRRRRPAPDGPPVHDRALPRAPRGDPGGGPGDRDLDRRDRRVLRRDRGAVRGDARPARDRPLRPGLRGGLLGAAGDAGDAARRRRAGERRSGAA